MYLFPKIMELITEKDAADILVIAGGIIPNEDIIELKKIGIKEIFTPGTDTNKIVEFIKENIKIA